MRIDTGRWARGAGILTAALVALGWSGHVPAQSVGELEFERYELENGLRVVLSEDHSTPVVTVNLWYDVGSRDEREGRTGFAHFFEHMMFQGSEHVGKTEHLTMVESVGGSVNGTTNEDRTAYFETVPANRVNMALWLEADRMRSLAVTGENFENQRETVKEERRRGIDNQPYASSALASFYSAPFRDTGCPGYAHSPIGSMDDLNAAAVEDVQSFFDQYYVPSNATLVVVGDFDPRAVREMVERYFGDIPSGSAPEPADCRVGYAPGFRIDTVQDPNANLPAVFWSYRVPSHLHEDTYPLTLLARILGQGESSRLHRTLVKETGAALQANATLDSRKGSGLLRGVAVANQGVEADSLLALVRSEVERLGAEPPTADELEKAKNTHEARTVMGRQSVFEKSQTLQHYAHFHEEIAEVNRDVQRYLQVDRQDLERVIGRYLTRENLTVVVTLPQSSKEDAGSSSGTGASGRSDRTRVRRVSGQ